MDKRQILERAIQKAIEGGWLHEPIPLIDEGGGLYTTISYWIKQDHRTLVYRHDFAKALWGEKDWRDYDLDDRPHDAIWDGGPEWFEFEGPIWKYHLQQMVVADDTIKYLGENI